MRPNSIQIVPMTSAHAEILSKSINDEDKREGEALGLIPHRAIWRCWQRSVIRSTALVDGEVAMCWGTSGSMMGRVGMPWFITGKKAREIPPIIFARMYLSEAKKTLDIFPVLENWVDSRYDGAIRLLKLAGFHIDEPKHIGKSTVSFCRFHKGLI